MLPDGRPIESLKVVELKQELKKHGLSLTGSKSQLAERLKAVRNIFISIRYKTVLVRTSMPRERTLALVLRQRQASAAPARQTPGQGHAIATANPGAESTALPVALPVPRL